MIWVGGIVAYICLWWLCWFCVLPWGLRVPNEQEPGHAPSAPEKPRLGVKFAITSGMALVLYVLLDITIRFGWFDVFVDEWRVDF